MRLKILKIALIAAVIAALLLSAIVYWQARLRAPILLNRSQLFEIHLGQSGQSVLTALQAQKIIDAQWPLRLLMFYQPQRIRHLQAGEFRLMPPMDSYQLLALLSSDHVVQYKITIPEGYTFAQMRQLVDAAPKLIHLSIMLNDNELMQALALAPLAPEGQFFPTTYFYTKNMLDLTLYRQAYQQMQFQLMQAWQQRGPDLPYKDSQQALIMASLIESEAAVAEERDLIAGVFVRRLQHHMKLQTDPAVAYGLQLSSAQKLTRYDLTKDTPYNLYIHFGLPPTPINLPGRASIDAALHPAIGDALYFVASGNDHKHIFSANLAEHNAAVQHYYQWRNQQQKIMQDQQSNTSQAINHD